MTRECGACTLCCKVMGIHELDKPYGVWCPHCKPGSGCGIYETRPASCRTFTCGWLSDETIPDALRPDRSKVVLYFSANGQKLIARCDPGHPTAWRREPLYGQLKRWAARGWAEHVLVTPMVGDRTWVLTPNHEVDLGVVDPGARLAIAEQPDGTVAVTVAPR